MYRYECAIPFHKQMKNKYLPTYWNEKNDVTYLNYCFEILIIGINHISYIQIRNIVSRYRPTQFRSQWEKTCCNSPHSVAAANS